jgi:fucose permease
MMVGGFISGLGPLIPNISEEYGRKETDFGVVFFVRGIGYMLGAFSANIFL